MWRKQLHLKKTKTSTTKNGPWVSADVQAHIETPPRPLTNVDLEEHHRAHIIKVKIQINPSQCTSETYKINMSTFNYVQSEEFLALMRNWKIAIDGTIMTLPSVRNNYLRTMLRGKVLENLKN